LAPGYFAAKLFSRRNAQDQFYLLFMSNESRVGKKLLPVLANIANGPKNIARFVQMPQIILNAANWVLSLVLYELRSVYCS
jgi:hypothetical protein